MSEVIYANDAVSGWEAVINATEDDINSEGFVYVFNGENEIKNYVKNSVKPDIDAYAAGCREDIGVYAQSETQNMSNAIDDYVAAVSKPALDDYTLQKKTELEALKTAAQTAADNAETSRQGAQNLLQAFEVTADARTAAFDAHVQEETEAAEEAITSVKTSAISAFNQNAVDKQALTDAAAEAAEASKSAAAASALQCQEIWERLGTVIKIKGRVDVIADLPAEGNADGDAYLVGIDGLDGYPEYFWYENHWEFLGTTGTKLSWGNVEGDINLQEDLQDLLAGKAGADEFESHAENKNNPHGVTKVQIGLGNCDNTSDANKPVSTAVQNALNLKANLISPAFSGTPTVPTPAVSDNSTKPATTNWFNQKIQVVSSLPASPNGNVFYFVTG